MKDTYFSAKTNGKGFYISIDFGTEKPIYQQEITGRFLYKKNGKDIYFTEIQTEKFNEFRKAILN